MLNETSETNGEGGRAGEQKRKERIRVPTAQVLPSDRHSFDVHFDVLRRFVTVSHNGTQAVDASRVEGEGVPVQAGQLNVRFFRSIGLLTTDGRGLYKPTEDALRFTTARSVSDDKARPILRKLINQSWFANTAKSVLSPGTPMPEDQFLGELAIAAQTDRQRKEPALRTVVDYLVYAGIVSRENGMVSLSSIASNGDQQGEQNPLEPMAVTQVSLGPTEATRKDVAGAWHTLQTEDFSLKIRSDLGAIDDLSQYLATLKGKITRLQRADPKVASGSGEGAGSTPSSAAQDEA